MLNADMMGLKELKDHTVRISVIGGPCHGGTIRVLMDEEFMRDGTVTLHYDNAIFGHRRSDVYRLHPPFHKRSAKWVLVHDSTATNKLAEGKLVDPSQVTVNL